MKKNIIILFAIVSIMGFIAFGFSGNQTQTQQNDIEQAVASLQATKPAINKTTSNNSQFNVNSFGITKSFDKEISYRIKRKHLRPITKEKVEKATLIRDIVTGYPANWVKNYSSVEISAICNGKTLKAKGANETLTIEQKKLLKSADFSTNVAINVAYKSKNSVTDLLEDHEMNTSVTIVPSVEATYPKGYDLMIETLKEKGETLIDAKKINTNNLNVAIVNFTIGKKGDVKNVEIEKTSGDVETDESLIKLISEMPKWNPAKNAKDALVEQQFEFVLGGGC